jgi:hypothetical protein
MSLVPDRSSEDGGTNYILAGLWCIEESALRSVMLLRLEDLGFSQVRLGFDRCDKLSINYRYQRPIIDNYR